MHLIIGLKLKKILYCLSKMLQLYKLDYQRNRGGGVCVTLPYVF